MYATTGRWNRKLRGARVPVEGAHLWAWYWQMRGESALTMTEIAAYCRLLRVHMSPWEVSTLRAMDNEASAYFSERVKDATGKRPGERDV